MTEFFQIVVPVFNEEDTLESVVKYAKTRDYLHRMVFVDDASTDLSPTILQRWVDTEGVMAIRLEQNQKKEGAIRAALESLANNGPGLAPYTVLLDADSIITSSSETGSVEAQLQAAIEHMKEKSLGGIAFRIDAISLKPLNAFALAAFADYAAMQFDQWLVSHQFQLWVINGPGGLFETEALIAILRTIEPDFETGDLLITVELMKQSRGIAFYPAVTVETYVPTDTKSYFKQRRRWERGTTKILWRERSFYIALFHRPSLLALVTLIHLSLYVGFLILLIMLALQQVIPNEIPRILFLASLVWMTIGYLKGVWLKLSRPQFPFFRFCGCTVLNAAVGLLVTTPARFTGFVEAIYQLARLRGAVIRRSQFDQSTLRWLSRRCK